MLAYATLSSNRAAVERVVFKITEIEQLLKDKIKNNGEGSIIHPSPITEYTSFGSRQGNETGIAS